MSDALMWAGFGKGLADAGSTMASFLMKAETAREDREARMTLRREELAYREANDLANREFRESQNALYKKAVGAGGGSSSGGGGGKGGIALEDLSPGGKAESIIAMNSGMTLPEYQRFRKADTTGDFTSFMKDEIDIGPSGEESTVSRLPPQFKEYADAKRKQIGAIIESYALGPAFDDVQKGRQTGLITSIGEKAYTSPETAPVGGQAVAVMGGKPLVEVKDGMQFNQYTGTSKVTPVGQSQITENQAQAGAQGALGKKYNKEIEKIDAEIAGGKFSKNSAETLTSIANATNNTLTGMRKDKDAGLIKTPEEKAAWDKRYAAENAKLDRVTKLQNDALDLRDTGKPKPETGAPKAEAAPTVKTLPAGATLIGKSNGKNVYALPDGTRYIQK
jgi:hypothetical protein